MRKRLFALATSLACSGQRGAEPGDSPGSAAVPREWILGGAHGARRRGGAAGAREADSPQRSHLGQPRQEVQPCWRQDRASNDGREQKVLVIFAKFTDTPPGGPDTRLDPGQYFDAMLFGTTYDPPEWAGYPGHPTNATLYNYYKENSTARWTW